MDTYFDDDITSYENIFTDKCVHDDIYIQDNYETCNKCGLIVKKLEYKSEWNFSNDSKSRCVITKDKPCVCIKLFEQKNITITSFMGKKIDEKYNTIVKKTDIAFRGKKRTSLLAICYFYTLYENNDIRCLDDLELLFDVEKKCINEANELFLSIFPIFSKTYILQI